MKGFLTAAAGCVFTGLFGATAAAQDALVEQGQWYFSPMISYVFDDPDRLSDPGGGLHLGFGTRIAPHFLLELNAVGNRLDGFAEYGQWGLGLDLLAIGDRGRAVSPYGILGVGYLDTHAKVPAGGPRIRDSSDFMAALGIGLLVPLGDSGNSFRTDLRVRNAFADSTLSDIVLHAGFLIPLGASSTPAVLPDNDHDGVPDAQDRCPGTAPGARVDEYGCEPDSDGDGVVNRKDKCPNTRRGATVNADGCEVIADSDGDGVPDDRDVCPGTPRGTRVGTDGCELDSDGDGVVDSKDQCPGTAKGVRVDFRGCEIRDEISLPGVNFEFDSARLTPDSLEVLNQAAGTLQRYQDLKVECAGHTDALGPDDYNQRLSQKRAEAVCEYLLARGVAPARLTARGYGETRPVADNATAEGQARNRRVSLRIVE